MRRIEPGSGLAALAVLAMLGALAPGSAAHAQEPIAYQRALELEQADKYREAATAYRDALRRAPASVPALLGLERVYAQLGMTDSLVPVIDAAISARPSDPTIRAVQLRTLHTMANQERLRQAFDRWRRDAPHDPTPYREYARLLLQEGQTAAADSVLRLAQMDIGSTRGLEFELAQLRAATGRWELAAQAWRTAVEAEPYLERAAAFSLVQTPVATRAAVVATFVAPPPSVYARHVAASLLLEWGEPRAGWEMLQVLRADTATLSAWTDFAQRAEEAQAWLVARDALSAVFARTRSPEIALRAASDALAGGDSRSALTLAGAVPDSGGTSLAILPVRLRALAGLGRPDEAERALASVRQRVSSDQYARLARIVAWAWVRAGDLGRARALLGANGDADDPVYGWLALYEGNLGAARRLLRQPADAAPDFVTALALLARVRADSVPAVGHAFLLLARGDTIRAAAAFEDAARALPEGAPLLLATSGRLYAARHDDARAVVLWKDLLDHYPDAPEAPEAELEWARALRRAGQNDAAGERLEHLILTYPQSALLPQARRELELARASVPPTP